jgi:L-lactate dehydrogenase complex protein LldG
VSARDEILNAVRLGAPPARSLPPDVVAAVPIAHKRLVDGFAAAAAASGASIVHARAGDAAAVCDGLYSGAGRRISVVGPVDPTLSDAPRRAFADTDVFCCAASLGIVENGAVWLPLSQLRHRAALFLATNVIVLLDSMAIVPTFHDAYEYVDVSREAFGVFVAGPSKTADIEQSLVVGAHGPKSLTIVLTDHAGRPALDQPQSS